MVVWLLVPQSSVAAWFQSHTEDPKDKRITDAETTVLKDFIMIESKDANSRAGCNETIALQPSVGTVDCATGSQSLFLHCQTLTHRKIQY